jgi:uncharacterized protein YbjQ (UPF0145 family)
MDTPAASGLPGDNEAVRVTVRGAAPAMPAIRASEKYTASPFLLVDGTARLIGWQWSPADKGGPQFVVATRTALGGLKVAERFPLTEPGWAKAWGSLSKDPAAAAKAAAKLAQRVTEAAEAAEYGPMADPPPEPMLIVTTNDVPGHRITALHGDVFGLTVRARDYFSNIGASFRTITGGEVAGYTNLLVQSRNQARERMWQEARSRGANAIVAMRFDCNELGGIMSEVVAYGTAVTVEPVAADPPS